VAKRRARLGSCFVVAFRASHWLAYAMDHAAGSPQTVPSLAWANTSSRQKAPEGDNAQIAKPPDKLDYFDFLSCAI
jgi:hypothetical protein